MRVSDSMERAMPKSMIFTLPRKSIITFSGFRSMNDALCMSLFEAGAHLLRDADSLSQGHSAEASQDRAETLAFDEFHRGVCDTAEAVEFVDAADIFVSDFAREEKLVLEAVHHLLIGRDFGL